MYRLMGKLFGTEETPLYLEDRGVLGLELLNEVVCGDLGVDQVPSGEDIYRGIAVFRPRMDGEMGLGYDHHPADAKGAELVESDLNDGRFCLKRGIFECFLDKFQIA